MKLFAKKSLGQHFLNSKHVLDQIISAANIKEGETILEIGPGTGILTEALLNAGANVVAVDKDARMIDLLKEKFAGALQSGNLIVHEGDILESPPASNTSYSVISNIPYYITGAILEKFLEHEPRPGRMILLVQKEVATRIIARDKKESILSVSVKAFGKPKLIATVPAGAFTPPPSVDSAILSISDISDREFSTRNINTRRFFEILRAGFAHKRKFLIRNLEVVIDPARLKAIWAEMNLNEKVRAEDLFLDQWLTIAQKASVKQ